MKLTIYQVDAFAEKVFEGNPAAVCPLKEWLNDALLLKMAAENNLSETAFYVIREDRVEIRWFTPNTEVDLCGHATLATAFILHTQEGFTSNVIPFYSNRSGHLPVTINNDNSYTLDFPLDHITRLSVSETLLTATSLKPIDAYIGKSDIMLIFEKQEEIEQLKPNLSVIKKLEARGVIVTAKGNDCDFVSRFFGPQVGVDEDPVTGSAHTTLTNYWAIVLNKNEFTAEQISTRKGKLKCKKVNNRVEITGKAILYMKGEITI
ncbi:PhzF family phenazine biosynthesis protein [bacterium]|nr:PhzF family phenazine biosynthesis protein [Candidatus Elulimicrobium humile]